MFSKRFLNFSSGALDGPNFLMCKIIILPRVFLLLGPALESDNYKKNQILIITKYNIITIIINTSACQAVLG